MNKFGKYFEIPKEELEIEIPKDFEGIHSYNDLEYVLAKRYENCNEKQVKQYTKRLYLLLESIDNFLKNKYESEIDSIKYLYYLREIKGLSFRDIAKYFQKNRIKTSSRGLAQILKDFFGWKSKGKHDSSPTKKIKDQKKSWKRGEIGKQKREKESEELKNYWLKKQKNISLDDLDISGNIIEKTRKVFNILGIIKEKEFKKKILELREKYGCQTTALAITKILEENNLNLTFSRSRIYEIK